MWISGDSQRTDSHEKRYTNLWQLLFLSDFEGFQISPKSRGRIYMCMERHLTEQELAQYVVALVLDEQTSGSILCVASTSKQRE